MLGADEWMLTIYSQVIVKPMKLNTFYMVAALKNCDTSLTIPAIVAGTLRLAK